MVEKPLDDTENATMAPGNTYGEIGGVITYEYASTSTCLIDLTVQQIRPLLCLPPHGNKIPREFAELFQALNASQRKGMLLPSMPKWMAIVRAVPQGGQPEPDPNEVAGHMAKNFELGIRRACL